MARVLVVDDEPGVREIVKTQIEFEGIDVLSAADGVEALHLAETEEFDVVLSDILMPRMDGLTLAGELAKVQPETVVILMTGYPSVNTAVEAIKRGVFDYIMKPFQNTKTVVHSVHRAIERKQLNVNRRVLVEDLKRANDDLADHRQLLMEKVSIADTELARRLKRLSILYEVSRSASSIARLDQLLKDIMEKVFVAMNHSPGILWLLDENRDRLRREVTMGLKGSGNIPEYIEKENGIWGDAIKMNRIVVFRSRDDYGNPLLRQIAGDEHAAAVSIVPLFFENTALGAFMVFSRDSHGVTEDDINLIAAVADQVSVSIKNAELYSGQQRLFRETIEALATAIDSRDHYTGGHSYIVTQYSMLIAEKMGLAAEQMELIRLAGLLHDIGKIGISDLILNKPEKLTEEEMGVIKAHPILGRMIIESIESLKPAARIVYHHHEHYDGSGYPEGVKGEDIPIESRILQVADIFHALTSDRVYRKALSLEQAIAVIQEEIGTIIDPKVGKIFLEIIRDDNFSFESIQMLRIP